MPPLALLGALGAGASLLANAPKAMENVSDLFGGNKPGEEEDPNSELT